MIRLSIVTTACLIWLLDDNSDLADALRQLHGKERAAAVAKLAEMVVAQKAKREDVLPEMMSALADATGRDFDSISSTLKAIDADATKLAVAFVKAKDAKAKHFALVDIHASSSRQLLVLLVVKSKAATDPKPPPNGTSSWSMCKEIIAETSERFPQLLPFVVGWARSDATTQVRIDAVDLLSGFGDKAAKYTKEIIGIANKDKEVQVRVAAIGALGQVGDRALATTALESLRLSNDGYISSAANKALQSLKEKRQ